MIRAIRCIHCGTRTKTIFRDVKSVVNTENTIVLKNSPMHYCSKCNDSLLPLDVIDTLTKLKALPLKPGLNEFEFTEVHRKITK